MFLSLIRAGNVSSQVRHNYTVDTLSAAFFAIFAGAFYPFVAALAVQMGAEEKMVGLIVAAPFVAQLFTMYWGHLCQERKKLPFIIYPGILARVVIIPLAFIGDVRFFILLVILHHLVGAIAWPAFTGLMQKIYPVECRGRLMGKVRFVFGFFHILATATAGVLIDVLGFGPVFIAVSLLGIVGALVLRRIKEPAEGKRSILCSRFSLLESLSLLRKNPVLGRFILGISFFDFGFLVIQPVLPLYWVNILDLSNNQIGQISIMFMASWFLSSPLWGVLIDRTRPVISVYGAVLIYLAVPLIYLGSPLFAGVLLGAAFAGTAMAAYETGWSNNLMRLGGSESSRYVGLYLSLVGVRGLLGPLLGAYFLRTLGRELTMLMALLFIISSFIPLLLSDRQTVPQNAVPQPLWSDE